MNILVKKKKKIGIITLNGYFNYGNRLQNYAVEQILQSLDFEVKTIRHSFNKDIGIVKNLTSKFSRIKKMNNQEIFDKLKNKFRYYANKKSIDEYKKAKHIIFKEFSDEYLNESDYIISPNDIPDFLINEFDYFVVGSDQVWNPANISKSNPINFLTFAPLDKRIAYSPSFGVSNIPDELKDRYKKWLSNMKHLSVREKEGSKIIKELIGEKTDVLIDPTLMLSQDHWESISINSDKKPNNDYLLTYILGDLSSKKKEEIENFARKNDLEIFDLAMSDRCNDFVIGPREFLDCFNSASAIFTDSFHGTVFSILFNKPFVTFERKDGLKSMISRIENILEIFNMNNRFEKNINYTRDEIFNINFDDTHDILKKERKKAYSYLKKSLK